MSDKIWLSPPHMGGEELNFVKEAFDSNWIAPLGPNVNGFEDDLARYTGIPHVAALSSGTAALHLALIMLGVKRDDVVLCQSFTFSASANPIVYQGATPVFIDSERDTWNISPDFMEEAIRDGIRWGKKPKAVIVVHLYGMPAKMDEIMEICRRYEVPVIEDAAEALGSKYNGRHLGSWGDMAILSFNGNKIITTSGGGALVSNNREYIEQAKFLSTQARDDAPHYQHSHIGYNYRMSNVIAGIGRGQMQVIDERVKRKRGIFEWYKKILGSLDCVEFQPEMPGMYSNRWLTSVIFNPKNGVEITREDVRQAFNENNIDSRPLWKPMHLQPIFEGAPFFGDGTSEEIFNKGLCLPSGTSMTTEQMDKIRKILLKYGSLIQTGHVSV